MIESVLAHTQMYKWRELVSERNDKVVLVLIYFAIYICLFVPYLVFSFVKNMYNFFDRKYSNEEGENLRKFGLCIRESID